jgi:hypothetical protein
MKIKHLIPVFILLALGTLSSCDLFDNADDISFDATLPLDFVIDENQDNPNGKDYSSTKTLDAKSDPDVAKYASKIKEFKVNKITYTISGADPSTVTLSNGKLVIVSSGKVLATASSVSLSNTAETELSSDVAGFNDLASLLLSDQQEDVKMEARLSQTPVAFSVKFKFYVTITADAL